MGHALAMLVFSQISMIGRFSARAYNLETKFLLVNPCLIRTQSFRVDPVSQFHPKRDRYMKSDARVVKGFLMRCHTWIYDNEFVRHAESSGDVSEDPEDFPNPRAGAIFRSTLTQEVCPVA
jgi:hypothetical protein